MIFRSIIILWLMILSLSWLEPLPANGEMNNAVWKWSEWEKRRLTTPAAHRNIYIIYTKRINTLISWRRSRILSAWLYRDAFFRWGWWALWREFLWGLHIFRCKIACMEKEAWIHGSGSWNQGASGRLWGISNKIRNNQNTPPMKNLLCTGLQGKIGTGADHL